jgi:hypothetical protein
MSRVDSDSTRGLAATSGARRLQRTPEKHASRDSFSTTSARVASSMTATRKPRLQSTVTRCEKAATSVMFVTPGPRTACAGATRVVRAERRCLRCLFACDWRANVSDSAPYRVRKRRRRAVGQQSSDIVARHNINGPADRSDSVGCVAHRRHGAGGKLNQKLPACQRSGERKVDARAVRCQRCSAVDAQPRAHPEATHHQRTARSINGYFCVERHADLGERLSVAQQNRALRAPLAPGDDCAAAGRQESQATGGCACSSQRPHCQGHRARTAALHSQLARRNAIPDLSRIAVVLMAMTWSAKCTPVAMGQPVVRFASRGGRRYMKSI